MMMRDGEVLVAVVSVMAGVVCLALLLFTWLRHRRLRVLERLLRRNDLDDVTRRALLDELRQPRRPLTEAFRAHAAQWVFGLGWLAFFVGIGCMLTGDREGVPFGAVLATFSFGLVSLPMALRELERRRA